VSDVEDFEDAVRLWGEARDELDEATHTLMAQGSSVCALEDYSDSDSDSVIEIGYYASTRVAAVPADASSVAVWKQAAADWVYGGTELCGWHTQQRLSEQDFDTGGWHRATRVKYVESSLEQEVVDDVFGGVDPGCGRVVMELVAVGDEAPRDGMSVWVSDGNGRVVELWMLESTFRRRMAVVEQEEAQAARQAHEQAQEEAAGRAHPAVAKQAQGQEQEQEQAQQAPQEAAAKQTQQVREAKARQAQEIAARPAREAATEHAQKQAREAATSRAQGQEQEQAAAEQAQQARQEEAAKQAQEAAAKLAQEQEQAAEQAQEQAQEEAAKRAQGEAARRAQGQELEQAAAEQAQEAAAKWAQESAAKQAQKEEAAKQAREAAVSKAQEQAAAGQAQRARVGECAARMGAVACWYRAARSEPRLGRACESRGGKQEAEVGQRRGQQRRR
jgi:hypothetical protein